MVIVDISTARPADTDRAFVQYGPQLSTWHDLGTVRPQLDGIREDHVRYNCHLNHQVVPDAYGLMVLTGAHLERAHD